MRNAFTIKTSLVALAATLAVAGCNKAPTDAADNAQVSFALPELPATLPLAAGTGEPISYAPEASALPDAKPLRVAQVADPQQAYGYADAAYEYSDALGDAPPDYGFDYDDGVEPWAWQGYDNSLAFAEPIDDGYRTYYYRPGATEPYFIRDPYYSYGFADGLLSVIYAADGGIVPYADYGPRLAYASRYYARGRGLYSASRRGNRRAIYASNWRAQSPILFASRTRWGAGRAHQPAWGAYHNANVIRQQRYWREETIRRQADTRRFADWRNSDFRTPAPPRAIPAAWSNAKWARDDTKFRPASDTVRQGVLNQRQQAARQDERAAAAGQRAAQQRVAERQALRQDAKQDRQQAGRQQQRAQAQGQQQQRQQDQAQAERQQAQRQQAAERRQDRAQGQRQQQAERRQDRTQGQPAPAPRQQQAERQQQRAQEQRQQDRSQVQRQQAQRQQQADRQRERAQAQQQQGQRQQPAARVEQRRDQAAERQPAARAEQRQQAQAAQREQRQQAQQDQRQQAQQAQRAQAQAQRQQERQQARPEPRPQPERARQQPQPQAQPQPRPQAQQRQDARQERQEKRADRPNRE